MNIRISYSSGSNKFVIECPFHLNGEPAGMPSRKFNKRRKAWLAPVLRKNAEYMVTRWSDAEWTDEARAAADMVLNPPPRAKVHFPAQYPFKMPPFEKQRVAIDKHYDRDTFALFMEMGTGKTKVTIDVQTARKLEGKISAVVVVCPNSVKANWLKELGKHCPIDYSAQSCSTTSKKLIRWIDDPDPNLFKWLIVGIEAFSQGKTAGIVEKFMLQHQVSMVVDESSRIKTHSAKRTEVCIDLGKLCKYRSILTGTPMTKTPLDLFGQFEFLDTNILGLGDWFSFRSRYAVMGGYDNKQIMGYDKLEELIEAVSPYIYQVTKKEMLDLPPKVYCADRVVELTKEQKSIYRDLSKGFARVGDTAVDISNILERMLRQQQCASGFYVEYQEQIKPDGRVKKVGTDVAIPGKNPKIEELLAVLEDSPGSAIVWCRFQWEVKAAYDAICKRFPEEEAVMYYGGMKMANRAESKDKFESYQAKYLIGTAASGGIGIDLLAASHVIYLSNTFNLEDRLQSEDRAHRSGQDKTVTYTNIIADKTVDTLIIESMDAKKDLADWVQGQIYLHGAFSLPRPF